ncbi:MAG TPA: hypothetical protein VJV79_37685 [Polyangiaceae bacterium]|nr:hypothetical protein [Polyangiaceae bacterium]
MMFVHVARRTQIAELLSGRAIPQRREFLFDRATSIPPLDQLSVAAIWSSDPYERAALPVLLVTADGQERDWLAWLVTFAPALRPFTAFCRIVGYTAFLQETESMRAPALSGIDTASIGLILGELLMSSHETSSRRESPTASACASTLSFALIRDLAIHKRPVFEPNELPAQWSRIRKLTRQRERNTHATDVTLCAEVLRALSGGGSYPFAGSPIFAACHEILERGEVRAEAPRFGQVFAAAADAMLGTREERVDIFERVLSAPVISGGPPEEEAFSIGYLASRINPGTLVHAALVAPALQRYPAAMLWYGVCAGLVQNSNVLNELGSVGRRVERDLLVQDGLENRPRADIAASELEIFVTGERTDDFPISSPSQLVVELAPAITTVVNWTSRTRSGKIGPGDRFEDRGWIAAELEGAISRLTDLRRRLRNTDQHERGPEQAGLFDRSPAEDRPKKRR